jgi:peptidoglycan hydrolase CwlO-like protein
MKKRAIAEQRNATAQRMLLLSVEAAQHNINFVDAHIEPLQNQIQAFQTSAESLMQAIDDLNAAMRALGEGDQQSNADPEKEAARAHVRECQKKAQECEQAFQKAERLITSELTEMEQATRTTLATVEQIRRSFESSLYSVKQVIGIVRHEARDPGDR